MKNNKIEHAKCVPNTSTVTLQWKKKICIDLNNFQPIFALSKIRAQLVENKNKLPKMETKTVFAFSRIQSELTGLHIPTRKRYIYNINQNNCNRKSPRNSKNKKK